MIVYTAEVAGEQRRVVAGRGEGGGETHVERRNFERSRGHARSASFRASSGRSGLAAWLGWLFDGLDMHLYTLVAIPFVAELLGADVRSAAAWAKKPRGFRPRSWSAGRSAAESSAASAIASAAAGR